MPISDVPVDLHFVPKSFCSNYAPQHIALGDLHGNALKLLFHLVETGIMQFSDPDDYTILKKLYNLFTVHITSQELERFQSILDKAKVNATSSLTLIGDDCADRGEFDYFTLLVIERLTRAGMDIEILLSNHGSEFIIAHELGLRYDPNFLMPASIKRSLINTLTWLQQATPEQNEHFEHLVTNIYLPYIKAISTSYDAQKNQLTIFTHAPINLSTIQKLAEVFSISYSESTPEELVTCIDDINQTLCHILEAKQLHKWIYNDFRVLQNNECLEGEFSDAQNHPLYQLIWNRAQVPEDRCQPRNQRFQIQFVHGHLGMGVDVSSPYHTNLDASTLGKGLECPRGDSIIYYSDELTRLKQSIQTLNAELSMPLSPAQTEGLSPYLTVQLLILLKKYFDVEQEPEKRMDLIQALQRFPNPPSLVSPLSIKPNENETLGAFTHRLDEETKAIYQCQALKKTITAILGIADPSDNDVPFDVIQRLSGKLSTHKASFQNLLGSYHRLLDKDPSVYFNDVLIHCQEYQDKKSKMQCLENLSAWTQALCAAKHVLKIPYLDTVITLLEGMGFDSFEVARENHATLERKIKAEGRWQDVSCFYRFIKNEQQVHQEIIACKAALDELEVLRTSLSKLHPARTIFSSYFLQINHLKIRFDQVCLFLHETLSLKKGGISTVLIPFFEKFMFSNPPKMGELLPTYTVQLKKERASLCMLIPYIEQWSQLKAKLKGEKRVHFPALDLFKPPSDLSLSRVLSLLLIQAKQASTLAVRLENQPFETLLELLFEEAEALTQLQVCLNEREKLMQDLAQSKSKVPDRLNDLLQGMDLLLCQKPFPQTPVAFSNAFSNRFSLTLHAFTQMIKEAAQSLQLPITDVNEQIERPSSPGKTITQHASARFFGQASSECDLLSCLGPTLT